VKVVQESGMNFDRICAFVPEQFGDYALLDRCVPQEDNIFSGTVQINGIIQEIRGRFGESENRAYIRRIQRDASRRNRPNPPTECGEYGYFSNTISIFPLVGKQSEWEVNRLVLRAAKGK
jgi:hypothetical protein